MRSTVRRFMSEKVTCFREEARRSGVTERIARRDTTCHRERVVHAWDIVAVFVAAASGAIGARRAGMDFFGMFVLALVTGVGGGTLRSILIGDLPPLVLRHPAFVIIAMVATLVAFSGDRWWGRVRRLVSWVDALSIGIFMVVGMEVARDHHLAWWACLGMGVVTATFGGVLRDVLRAEVPLIFRKEIYASACIAGGLLYYLLEYFGLGAEICKITTIVVVTGIRLLALRYALHQSEG